MMGILKKMGHVFLFFCFLLFVVVVVCVWGGTRKNKYTFYKKKKKKKKKKRKEKSGNWDLISFPNRSSFIRFTDVCTHTFMLKSRLYNT